LLLGASESLDRGESVPVVWGLLSSVGVEEGPPANPDGELHWNSSELCGRGQEQALNKALRDSFACTRAHTSAEGLLLLHLLCHLKTLQGHGARRAHTAATTAGLRQQPARKECRGLPHGWHNCCEFMYKFSCEVLQLMIDLVPTSPKLSS